MFDKDIIVFKKEKVSKTADKSDFENLGFDIDSPRHNWTSAVRSPRKEDDFVDRLKSISRGR